MSSERSLLDVRRCVAVIQQNERARLHAHAHSRQADFPAATEKRLVERRRSA